MRLKLKVKPGSVEQELKLGKSLGGVDFEVSLKSRAEKGEANKELVSFLSDLLKIEKAKITIKSGQKSRKKTIEIDGEGIIEKLQGIPGKGD